LTTLTALTGAGGAYGVIENGFVNAAHDVAGSDPNKEPEPGIDSRKRQL
jgi:hypothetical protein